MHYGHKTISSPRTLSAKVYNIDKNGITSENIPTEDFAKEETIHGKLGKFAVNALVGLEVTLKNAPIAFGLDLRPGYGLMFTGRSKEESEAYKRKKEYYKEMSIFYRESVPYYEYFDWSVAASIRYTF